MTGRRSLRLLLATATGIARRAAATHRAVLVEYDVIPERAPAALSTRRVSMLSPELPRR